MTKKRLSSTELIRTTHSQRELALKQQDLAILAGGALINDDSHLDLTTRIRFLEACGGPPPFVLERIDKAGNVDRYLFERPFLIIGRSPACDVTCQEPSLSFRHVYLQYFNGVVWWFDLDSRSGVIYENQKRRAGCLFPGMTITAGEYTLRLTETSKKLPGPNPPARDLRPNTLIAAQQPDLPKVALEFENGKVGSEGRQLWPIENTITLLGRRSCCDLRFTDERVSRVHAGLVLTKDGLWIVDLLGRGGTKVNSVLSAYAYLHDGSLIQIGPYKMRVRYTSDHAQSHPAEAVLNEEDRPRRRRSRSNSQSGSVSEDLVYELVAQMADMQKQMFDQSQMQIGLLVQMLGSIHQSQQEMLKTELNRVHEISQEMHELQLRLAMQNATPQVATPAPPPLEPPGKAEATVPNPPREDDSDMGNEVEDSLPAPRLFGNDEEELAPANPGDAWPRAKSNEVQDHAMLFQRMQSLDRERNSRLQKIFRAFRGS